MDGTVREFRRGEAIDFDVPRVTVPATTKHQAGYPLEPGMDWIDVLIGSEGTLAITTRVTLRLLPNDDLQNLPLSLSSLPTTHTPATLLKRLTAPDPKPTPGTRMPRFAPSTIHSLPNLLLPP
jgi:hypothetical protein